MRSWVRLALTATNREISETSSTPPPMMISDSGRSRRLARASVAVSSSVIAALRIGGLSCSLHDPQRVVPLRQQFGFALPGLVQVCFLDVALAADVPRNRGDLRGEADVA